MCSWLRSLCRSVSLIVGSMALLMPGSARACSVCFGSSPADYGYFWAVLLLMAMPFAVSGSIGGWLFYTYRRARRRGVTLPQHGRARQEAMLTGPR